MALVICRHPRAAATYLADTIEAAIRDQDRIAIGLATGRTSAAAYDQLVRRHHCDPTLSFRRVTAFNTDEFVGLSGDDPHSSRYYMNRHLFHHIDIRLENTHVPRGDAVDLEAACRSFDYALQAVGGLDLVVLGLGHNGHVGFNEPGSSIRSKTRVVDFTESTLAALSDGNRFETLGETPTQAITMGLGAILAARHVCLIATGIGKANAVHRMFDGKPGPAVPASLLRSHQQLTIIVDQDAASTLKQEPDDTRRA